MPEQGAGLGQILGEREGTSAGLAKVVGECPQPQVSLDLAVSMAATP